MSAIWLTREAIEAASEVISTVDYPEYGPDMKLAQKVLAAALPNLRNKIASSVAEVDELLAGTVVRDAAETVYVCQKEGQWWDGPYNWRAADGLYWDADDMTFPVTILWEPERKE